MQKNIMVQSNNTYKASHNTLLPKRSIQSCSSVIGSTHDTFDASIVTINRQCKCTRKHFHEPHLPVTYDFIACFIVLLANSVVSKQSHSVSDIFFQVLELEFILFTAVTMFSSK